MAEFTITITTDNPDGEEIAREVAARAACQLDDETSRVVLTESGDPSRLPIIECDIAASGS